MTDTQTDNILACFFSVTCSPCKIRSSKRCNISVVLTDTKETFSPTLWIAKKLLTETGGHVTSSEPSSTDLCPGGSGGGSWG